MVIKYQLLKQAGNTYVLNSVKMHSMMFRGNLHRKSPKLPINFPKPGHNFSPKNSQYKTNYSKYLSKKPKTTITNGNLFKNLKTPS